MTANTYYDNASFRYNKGWLIVDSNNQAPTESKAVHLANTNAVTLSTTEVATLPVTTIGLSLTGVLNGTNQFDFLEPIRAKSFWSWVMVCATDNPSESKWPRSGPYGSYGPAD